MTAPIDIYLERGEKTTFAGALAWPGWCRKGRDEAAALRALVESGPRYAAVLQAAGLTFAPPADVDAFPVVERLTGNATTDMGAPDRMPADDARSLTADDLDRFRAVLEAIWRAFDRAVEAARGKELRKGPRGGGRDLDRIIEHVLGADAAYLARLAHKAPRDETADLTTRLQRSRAAQIEALAAARGEIPERGPRGGEIWKPRYFVRRVAWHALDHAWEIEDRIVA